MKRLKFFIANLLKNFYKIQHERFYYKNKDITANLKDEEYIVSIAFQTILGERIEIGKHWIGFSYFRKTLPQYCGYRAGETQ